MVFLRRLLRKEELLSTNKKLTILIFVTSIILLAVGLFSELSLGDEVYHYRFAKDIFYSGKRATFDSLYGSGNPPGYLYVIEPLWHIFLALLWQLCGNVYFCVAQFYQTIYYALLILFTFLLGKEIYGQKEGLYAALIVATMPVVISFSILFYLDVPATCFSILCILLFIKKKYLWSGFILGLMYLTKRNAFFFAPAFFFLILIQREVNFRKKVKEIFCLLIMTLLFILPDILWRENNLKSKIVVEGKVVNSVNLGTLEGTIDRFSLMIHGLKNTEYLNSYLSNPLDILKYLGIPLLCMLFLYVVFIKYEKKDLHLWVLIIFFYIFFCFIFNPGSDIRYIVPVLPLLAIISAKMLNYLKWGYSNFFLITICLLQFTITVFYVGINRQIPKDIEDGFNYIKNNTPKDSLVIYPEYVIIEKTNRRFVWAGIIPLEIKTLFWSDNISAVENSLKSFNINYIAIKKSRIYDDSQIHHFGGYPKSFVEKLPSFPFLELVFNNSAMSIWKNKNLQKSINKDE